MTKPLLSIISCPPDNLESAVLDLIELDRQLSKNDFSYEVIIPCANPAVRDALGRSAALVRGTKVVDPIGAADLARGPWRLFIPLNQPALIDEFPKIVERAKLEGDIFIGTPPRGGFLRNFLVRLFLKSRHKDHFACFRCFNSRAILIFKEEALTDWHSSLTPLILAKIYRLNVIDLPLSRSPKCRFRGGIIFLCREIFNLRRRIAAEGKNR